MSTEQGETGEGDELADDPFYSPNYKPSPRAPKPGELLFEFVREQDHKHFRCELRFHGESYGWEAQFLEGGQLVLAHGGFATRAGAVHWADRERRAIEAHQ